MNLLKTGPDIDVAELILELTMNFDCLNCGYAKRLSDSQHQQMIGKQVVCPQCKSQTLFEEEVLIAELDKDSLGDFIKVFKTNPILRMIILVAILIVSCNVVYWAVEFIAIQGTGFRKAVENSRR
jgi:DNA-directed RNA polymerase subunit RPC12/RpoP